MGAGSELLYQRPAPCAGAVAPWAAAVFAAALILAGVLRIVVAAFDGVLVGRARLAAIIGS
jgi:hypothetical protein